MQHNYDFSILVPGIRPGNWTHLYESIKSSTSRSFEMIIISPYDLPRNLEGNLQIKLIKSFSGPLRAQQLGLIQSTGKYVSWAADDGWYLPNALDVSFNHLESTPNSVVVGKYNEGPDNKEMDDINYYYFARHDGSSGKYVPQDCLMLMCGVIPRELLFEIGGWDCQFEVCPMGYIDVSIRLYNRGCKFIFQNEMMFRCGHMPGTVGDHAPIHYAQTQHDSPLFKLIYSRENSKQRINIPLDNYKKYSDRWGKRFGAV